MKKFKNKYRVPSTRAPFWNYGWNAPYFVTICTSNRKCWFGSIVETHEVPPTYKMEMTDIGSIANKFWLEIPEHFPFVKLGAHIIMPNHVHGIIIIDKQDNGGIDNKNDKCNMGQIDGGLNPSTEPPTKSRSPQPPKNKFGPQSQNLASIIRGYKTGVTKYARQNNNDFAWQPRYHDHIIRDKKSFQTISNYIMNNPARWRGDKFYNSGT